MQFSNSARTFLLFTAALLVPFLAAGRLAATDKLVDKILFPHDPSPEGVYRWSEGTILNFDGNKHLMMLVSGFGHGGHDSSTATILEFRSRDGGLTWTPLDEAKVFQENIGKQNVMAPTLLRLDNGEILCIFNVINSIRDGGPWMRRSADEGKTWSEPVRLPYTGYGSVAPQAVIQTRSGRIVVPCWVSFDSLASDYVYCFYSDDRGEMWKKTELMTTDKGSTGRKTDPAAEEPTVIELKDGRLMMFMRTYLKSIYVSYSDDGGATWSKPSTSGIPSPGSMPTLARMPDGNILLIWNWAALEEISGPFPRKFITAAVSTDEGKNFTCVRHLDGAAGFPGKITMANVAFAGENAVITYSKSMTRKNAYDWRLQVIPIKWFYEGDTTQVYGQKYVPKFGAALKALKP